MIPTVYASISNSVSLYPRFSPKATVQNQGENRIARGRRGAVAAMVRFHCFNWNLLLLLLLLRIRYVYSIREIKSERIRSVYGWISRRCVG